MKKKLFSLMTFYYLIVKAVRWLVSWNAVWRSTWLWLHEQLARNFWARLMRLC